MSDSLAPFALIVELDRDSPVPLYDQIAKPNRKQRIPIVMEKWVSMR